MKVVAYDRDSGGGARGGSGAAAAGRSAEAGGRRIAAHVVERNDRENDRCGSHRENEKRRGWWCARGELIDEAALAEALKSGALAGAAVDTFATEPPKNSPLVGLPNLIATPHIAGSTAEAQEEVGTAIALQIRDYLAEGVIKNAVNMPALSPDQYRRLKPYLELGERLGAFVGASCADEKASAGILIRYAGEAGQNGYAS